MENMYVNLVANPDDSGNYTAVVGGAMIRLTTPDDRKLFGMTDTSVKDAIKTLFGKRPDDVFYNDPTKWGDRYAMYEWPPITLTLRPESAVFTGIDVTNTTLATNEVSNQTDKVVQADVSFITQLDNTAETNWSQTSTLTVTQDVRYGIKFFGASTGISFSQDWQQGGSHMQTVSIGSNVSIFFELEPGETVVVANWGDIGTAKVRVTYAASLSGLVFANYSDTYQGHHFWGLDINGVLNTLGVRNRIEIVQNMELSSYLYTRTSIGYPSQARGEGQTLHTNNRLVFPADLTESLPQGTKCVVGGGSTAPKGAVAGSGDVPTMDEIFEPEPQNAQGHRHRDDDDEPQKKVSDGNDAQGYREEPDRKGAAGQDAQKRRYIYYNEEVETKGTAGQDAQGHRNRDGESLEGWAR